MAQNNRESDNTCYIYLRATHKRGGWGVGLTRKGLDRFYSKIDSAGEGDCWLWMSARMPRGYGQFHAGRNFDGKQDVRYAHRLMWELSNGRTLLPGEVVRHSCDNPPCCNPAHLLVGSRADNIADAQKQGKYLVAADLRSAATKTRQLAADLVGAPYGAIRKAADEHGVSYGSLVTAVFRERRRRQLAAASRKQVA
jgi:hypothetical protein